MRWGIGIVGVALGWLGCAATRTAPHVDRADVALAEHDAAELNDEHLAVQSAITDLAGARERREAVQLELEAARKELDGLRDAQDAAEKEAEARVRRRAPPDDAVAGARARREAGEAKVAWKEEAMVRVDAEVALAEARERLARAELERARLTLLRESDSPAAAEYRVEAFDAALTDARAAHGEARERYSAALAAERDAHRRYERLQEAVPAS